MLAAGGLGDGGDPEEHRRRIPVDQPLAHLGEPREPERFIERDGALLRVGDHPLAPDGVALCEGQRQDVSHQRTPDAEPLGAAVHAESGQAEHGERVPGQPASEGGVGDVFPLEPTAGHRGVPEQNVAAHSDPGHREVQLELILSGVVLEEAVDGCVTAPERGPVVRRRQTPDLNVGHASAPRGDRSAADRVEALLGPGDDHDDDDALLLFQAEATRAAGHTQRLGGEERPLPPLCAALDGYNLHAGVTVGARDRAALERLCRYVSRPPLALERLAVLPDSRVSLRLRRAWSDGTTAVVLTAEELVRRLVARVPGAEPRRPARTRSWNGRRTPACSQRGIGGALRWRHAGAESHQGTSRRSSGAVANGPRATSRGLRCCGGCSARTAGVAVLGATRCGGRMRLRGVVDGPDGPRQVLRWLAEHPPPVRRAVG